VCNFPESVPYDRERLKKFHGLKKSLNDAHVIPSAQDRWTENDKELKKNPEKRLLAMSLSSQSYSYIHANSFHNTQKESIHYMKG